MATPPVNALPRLRQILEREHDAISLFVELLRQEQSDLAKGHTDGLAVLAEKKNHLADQLKTLSGERNAVLSEEGFPADRPGVEAWCASHPQDTGVGEAWASVLERAMQAKEINAVNGELIALRMRHNAQALEALRSSKQPFSLYGPNGQHATAPNTRRINDKA